MRLQLPQNFQIFETDSWADLYNRKTVLKVKNGCVEGVLHVAGGGVIASARQSKTAW
jgi:hypothetical protein